MSRKTPQNIRLLPFISIFLVILLLLPSPAFAVSCSGMGGTCIWFGGKCPGEIQNDYKCFVPLFQKCCVKYGDEKPDIGEQPKDDDGNYVEYKGPGFVEEIRDDKEYGVEPGTISITLGDEKYGDDEVDDDGLIWAALNNGYDPGQWKWCDIDWSGGFIASKPENKLEKHLHEHTGTFTVTYRCIDRDIGDDCGFKLRGDKFVGYGGYFRFAEFDEECAKPYISKASDTIVITSINPPLEVEILKPQSDGEETGCPATFTGRVTGGHPPYKITWLFNDYLDIGGGEIVNDGGEHTITLMPGESDLPEMIGDIRIEVEDESVQYGFPRVIGTIQHPLFAKKENINLCCNPNTCNDCLTFSPKGQSVPFSDFKIWDVALQRHTSTADVISVGTPAVEEAVAKALAHGINHHPSWDVSNPDELNAEQRIEAIASWIRYNVGYLCDTPFTTDWCNRNCPECDGLSLCECHSVKALGFICKEDEDVGDLVLSGEDVLTSTSSCCPNSRYKYYGDCDDCSSLFISMARTAGLSEHCVATVSDRGWWHVYNAVYINNEWTIVETTFKAVRSLSWDTISYNDYNYFDITSKLWETWNKG